ncbi:hypothetical protein BDZ89DRAFT_1166236 [Hymenopellis radicata]|nr:hypothetical protein BDZ89DRAFT_1166236 [Hymenopellis radicata]
MSEHGSVVILQYSATSSHLSHSKACTIALATRAIAIQYRYSLTSWDYAMLDLLGSSNVRTTSRTCTTFAGYDEDFETPVTAAFSVQIYQISPRIPQCYPTIAATTLFLLAIPVVSKISSSPFGRRFPTAVIGHSDIPFFTFHHICSSTATTIANTRHTPLQYSTVTSRRHWDDDDRPQAHASTEHKHDDNKYPRNVKYAHHDEE